MKFADIFVRRPILVLVVSSLIVMLGMFALNKLPIRQYPSLGTSAITISTTYLSASAELIQGFVTQPIAQAVSTVEGLDYLLSSSSAGLSMLTLRMELNRTSTRALAEATAKVYVLANVRVNTYMNSVGEFRDLIIRNNGSSLVLLRDVGTVELGTATTQTKPYQDGESAVYLSLFSTPNGNPLVIVDSIKKLLPAIEKNLPRGSRWGSTMSVPTFSRLPLVMKMLLEAVLIVMLVIWLNRCLVPRVYPNSGRCGHGVRHRRFDPVASDGIAPAHR